jgi:hypothetical protein
MIIGSNPYNSPGYHNFAHDRSVFDKLFEQTIPDKFTTLFRELILEYYRMVQADSGKPNARFFAEKGTPDDTPRRAARTFFGSVREIVIVRDPRDLLCSAMQFWRQPAQDVLAFLTATLPRLERIRRQRDADTLFVRYEDLIVKPEDTRQAIFRFIGLDNGETAPPEPDLFSRHGTSPSPLASIGRWRNELNALQIAACEVAFGSFMDDFGYTRAGRWHGIAAAPPAAVPIVPPPAAAPLCHARAAGQPRSQ